MFSKSAELYDRIYFEFKDYETEARKINERIQSELPFAQTLLDVACGTGEHAKKLCSQYGYRVDGIDLNNDFVYLARQKNLQGDFYCADMVDFDLGRPYDVVMCLFSSIGYVRTLERVESSLKRFKAHTKSGGLILVEPWFTPDEITSEKIYLNTAEVQNLSIARMGYSQVRDRISILHFDYLIGRPGNIDHVTEIHELGLFTVDEMKQSFKNAELDVVYDEQGLSGRGLYIAKT
jgi:SAM-dependent methyltransferase